MKDFAKGDRVVADVGITVRLPYLVDHQRSHSWRFSATTASTAVVANPSSVRTLTPAASLKTVVLLNTSSSELWPSQLIGICLLMCDIPVSKRNAIRSTT